MVYLGVCSAVIGYEVVLGVVRVQDYFTAYYIRYVHSRLIPNIRGSQGGGGGGWGVLHCRSKKEHQGGSPEVKTVGGGGGGGCWVCSN